MSRLLSSGPQRKLGGRRLLQSVKPGAWSLQGQSIPRALERTRDRCSPFIQCAISPALVSHFQSPSCCFCSLSRTLCECWHIALQISGMEEPLEIPVLNDLTMVLGSIAQVHTFCRCKFSGCFFRASSANCVVCSFSREQLAWLLISVNLQLFMTMSSRYVDVHLQQGK